VLTIACMYTWIVIVAFVVELRLGVFALRAVLKLVGVKSVAPCGSSVPHQPATNEAANVSRARHSL